jgi:hypothetical protein
MAAKSCITKWMVCNATSDFLIDDLWGTLIFRNRHVVGFNGYFMKVYRDAVERKYQT